MKRVLLVPDGMADEPIAELGGRTPLAVADTPAMDALARRGTVGLVRTVPAGMPPGSDVGNLSVLGYDPAAVYCGRSPLEAVNIVDLGPDDVSYRCNLVTVSGGIMKDNTAGHIGNDDAHRCFAALSERLDGDGFEFHAGVTYRGLLVWRGGELVACTPPHDILDQPVAGHLPGEQAGGAATPAARRLAELQRRADEVLAGVRPATNAWLWGEGRAPSMPRFADLYALRGAVVAAVDLVRGIGRLAGLDVIDVPGATGDLDTDYGAKARAALEAIATHDLVWVHVEAPDEAAHMGSLSEKIKAIERVDHEVLAPLVASGAAVARAARPPDAAAHPHARRLAGALRVRPRRRCPAPLGLAGARAQRVRGRAHRGLRRRRSRPHAAVPRGDRLRGAVDVLDPERPAVTGPTRDGRRDAPVTTTAERYVMGGSRAARLVAMEGELLLYTNPLGHAPGGDDSVLGLYYRDTRHLSRMELLLGGRQPVVLTSSDERGFSETVELTNLELRSADGRLIPQAAVHVRRTRVLADRLYELVRVRNYHRQEVDLVLDLHFDADFADLFEIRGLRRRRRGRLRPPEAAGATLTFAYEGLDEVVRSTAITFHDPPASLRGGRARYRLRLAPGERAVIRFDVAVDPDPPPALAPSAGAAASPDLAHTLGAVRLEHERWAADATDVYTDNEQLNAVLRRAQNDLRLLTMPTSDGRVTLAGVPWFAAPFARAMLVVGLETLLLDLRYARSGVRYLARRQGRVNSAFREEQPGKIMHELRRGELANLRTVPHTPYFGAIDTTPLWLLTLAELTMWSGDLEGFDLLHDPVEAAVKWLAVDGDADGDGFVEYERRSRAGLLNQGWRDAGDAVVHADGTRAKGPVALAEVQGYVYYAKRRLAAIYGQLGDVERAERMAQEARDLKQRFNERFWMEDEQFFAMALDGEKRQVKTVCSTIGHCLWSRIVADEHVDAVARRLMAPDMFTGWGVRTVSKASVAYNPMSFYNGGVWPFDTAIAANGLKKHGYPQESNRLAYGLFETALAYENSRLPELFCGFNRQSSPRPVSFPMACRPHAAASGALFLVLQSMLGIYAQADENVVYVHNPVLPKWIGELGLRNLTIGRTAMDLVFRRSGTQTGFSVRDKKGPGRIVVVE